jgi:hypothetical protein
MKNLNYKVFLYILLGVSAISWFCIASITGRDMSKLYDFITILPTVATVDLFLFLIFRIWGWRLGIFHDWLVPFPDLSGTWQGHIQTTWKNPETGEVPGPIPVILTIKQSFGNISCVMRTIEMISHSFSEDFRIEKDNQIKQLAYIYDSKPKNVLNDRSIPHDGTIVFDILGKPANKLSGQYWTSRKSTGEITLTFREKNILDEMPEDLATHPMKSIV